MSRHSRNGDREQFWRRTVAARDRATPPARKAAAGPAFVPVAAIDAPLSPRRETPIDILLATGRRVRVRSGCNRSLLVAVLAVLDATTSRKSPAAIPCQTRRQRRTRLAGRIRNHLKLAAVVQNDATKEILQVVKVNVEDKSVLRWFVIG